MRTHQPDLVRIVFTKNQPPYNAGEGARRDPAGAMKLVLSGVAKFLDPPPGLDEFGEPLEKKVAPKKATTPKPKAKAKAKPNAKAKPRGRVKKA